MADRAGSGPLFYDRSYALFSGGHDSLAATLLASREPTFAGVVHINTGIGIEETRQFVRDTCAERHWPLTELHAPDGEYRRLVLTRGGFPYGVKSHHSMLWYLKQKPLNAWVAAQESIVGLVTGIRRDESVRRMGSGISVPERRDGRKVWLSPILDWSGLDVSRFIDESCLTRNPVVDLLHRSGECLCGALAQEAEIHEIARWYPETAETIQALERECEALGISACVWAGKTARQIHADQQPLFAKSDYAPLCSSCEARAKPRLTPRPARRVPGRTLVADRVCPSCDLPADLVEDGQGLGFLICANCKSTARWEWCEECQGEYGPGHRKAAHRTPGLFRWRQRRWWAWFVHNAYAAGLISGSTSSGHRDGWIVHSLCWRGRRPYVLWIDSQSWGDPWHRLRCGHWPKRVQLGICGVCAPMPCCGSTGFDCLEGCDGDF